MLLFQFGGEIREYWYANKKAQVKRKTIDGTGERGRVAKAKSQNK